MNRVEDTLPSLNKGHRRGVIFQRKRIEPETFFVVRNSLIRLTLIIKEGSQNQPVGVTGRAEHKEAIGIRRLRIIGPQNQVFATLAAIWPRRTGISHKPEKGIIDGSRAKSGWDFDHHRTRLLQVEEGRAIHRVGVASEKQRIGIQRCQQHHFVVGIHPHPSVTCTQHFNAGSRHQCEKGFIRTDELEIVKAGINRGGIRHAVEETEGAHTGVHLVGR